jgi:hypothetical protein
MEQIEKNPGGFLGCDLPILLNGIYKLCDGFLAVT